MAYDRLISYIPLLIGYHGVSFRRLLVVVDCAKRTNQQTLVLLLVANPSNPCPLNGISILKGKKHYKSLLVLLVINYLV
jgi:hypothetical protein